MYILKKILWYQRAIYLVCGYETERALKRIQRAMTTIDGTGKLSSGSIPELPSQLLVGIRSKTRGWRQ